jgi:hemoglobin
MTPFYERAIEDKSIGPFFIHELGHDMQEEDWIHHIELLADFWLAKLNGENTYYGNFIGAHVKLPRMHKEHFTVWIALFSQAADEVYTPEVAERFKKKGIEFSKQFLNTTKKI